MTFLEAKQNLCSLKLNIGYDDMVAGNNELFSLQDIEAAMNYGIRRAWDYKIWPFSENFDTIDGSNAGSSGMISLQTPDGVKFQSIFLAVVNGTPWDGTGNGKRNFKDFVKWMSDYPTDASKIWAEFGINLYFNGNTGAFTSAYSIILYGKLACPDYSTLGTPADDTFGDDDLMPFSSEDGDSTAGTDGSGNDAIILFAYSYLLASEKKKQQEQAEVQEKNAYVILDAAWAGYSEGKSQNLPQNRPFFNVPNFFPGRPNRDNTIPGNFP
jgi:hypothetical protein